MDQCIQEAEHLGFNLQHALPKRKMSGNQSESAIKRITMPRDVEPAATLAAIPSTRVAILPRPATNSAEIPSMKAPQAPPPTPKKRGRPARADKARFRPTLPRQIAPTLRPVEQSQHSLESQHIDSSQGNNQASATPPQTFLPFSSPDAGLTPNLMNSNEGTFHARLATGEGKHLEASHPVAVPGPILFEPEPRASKSQLSSPPEEQALRYSS